MDVGLYTDSLNGLTFAQALDVAAANGIRAIEIATGGQSSAAHLPVDELLESSSRRGQFADAFTSRGLRIAALNCSAWPMHPRLGAARRAHRQDASPRLGARCGQDRHDVRVLGRRQGGDDCQLGPVPMAGGCRRSGSPQLGFGNRGSGPRRPVSQSSAASSGSRSSCIHFTWSTTSRPCSASARESVRSSARISTRATCSGSRWIRSRSSVPWARPCSTFT